MTSATDLVAFRKRREALGRQVRDARVDPYCGPTPKIGPKPSMLGFVDQIQVQRLVNLALVCGDRDPLTYVDATTWLERAGVDEIDEPTINAVLRDPRVRAVLTEVGIRAMALFEERRALAKPDPAAPTTLGWRLWHENVLWSPQQKTPWPSAELRVENYSESDTLRGFAGIHALRVPVDWRRAVWPRSCGVTAKNGIVGIVERFGRYVLGTEGWRAEWVFIRKLLAPNDEIGLKLESCYPDVEVYYANR